MAPLPKTQRRPYRTYSIKKRIYGLRLSQIRDRKRYGQIITALILASTLEGSEEVKEIIDIAITYFSMKWLKLFTWQDGPNDPIPLVNFTIEGLSEQDCLAQYRFTKQQLRDLYG
jgi:hypothetical protein